MSASYGFGPFTFDSQQLTLRAGREEIRLAPKVLHTLAILVEHSGDLVTKDELMDRLWPDGCVEEGNLTQNIYVLRRTMQAYGLETAIENVPKRGYRFVAVVRHLEAQHQSRRRRGFPFAIAASIAALLVPMLQSPGRTSSALPPDGARLYALGRYYWSLRTTVGLDRALADFEQIVKRYPRSALGYAGLADTYTEMYDYVCDGAPCTKTIALAQSYAREAVAVDASSSEAHTSAAMGARLFERNIPKSDSEFKRAIELDPRNALAYEWYGNALLARGDLADARRELQSAATLQPVSVATYAWLARDAYYSHRYTEAVAAAHEALAINPHRFETSVLLGLALEMNGNSQAAAGAFERLAHIGVSAHDVQALIAGVYAHAGRRTQAMRMLHEAMRGAPHTSWFTGEVALGYLAAGDERRAAAWLVRLHFQNTMDRRFFAMDPRLDSVRKNARFNDWTRV